MPSSALARSRKPRRGTELVCEKVFRPLAHPLVLVFARLRVPPPLVVVAAGAAGLAAAVELGRGSLLVAALLVQLKTLLDNADGQLARLTGRIERLRAVSRLRGRPARQRGALRRARAGRPGSRRVALAGFLALTSVLSLNFNVERLSRAAVAEPEAAGDGRPRCSAGSTASSTRRRTGSPRRSSRGARRSPARSAVSLLANLGMSTQLAAFGLLIALGHPLVFAWVALAEVAVIALALLPRRAPRRQEEVA